MSAHTRGILDFVFHLYTWPSAAWNIWDLEPVSTPSLLISAIKDECSRVKCSPFLRIYLSRSDVDDIALPIMPFDHPSVRISLSRISYFRRLGTSEVVWGGDME